jgi:hypothetical protein
MARTIAMLRPLCFAKWDRYFTSRDSNGFAKPSTHLAPLCRNDSPDPAQASVDDLRQACLTLQRADRLLAQAGELLEKQQAESEANFPAN